MTSQHIITLDDKHRRQTDRQMDRYKERILTYKKILTERQIFTETDRLTDRKHTDKETEMQVCKKKTTCRSFISLTEV